MKILDNLWFGEVHPVEDFLEGNVEYKKLLHIVVKDRDKVSEGLSHEQAEWLEKYDSAIKEMNAVAETEAFKYGFSLAVKMLTEATE